jgi:hypothetical protein
MTHGPFVMVFRRQALPHVRQLRILATARSVSALVGSKSLAIDISADPGCREMNTSRISLLICRDYKHSVAWRPSLYANPHMTAVLIACADVTGEDAATMRRGGRSFEL